MFPWQSPHHCLWAQGRRRLASKVLWHARCIALLNARVLLVRRENMSSWDLEGIYHRGSFSWGSPWHQVAGATQILCSYLLCSSAKIACGLPTPLPREGGCWLSPWRLLTCVAPYTTTVLETNQHGACGKVEPTWAHLKLPNRVNSRHLPIHQEKRSRFRGTGREGKQG